MKNIFLFPGQGAFHKGMLFDICNNNPEAMDLLKKIEQISDEPVSKYLWETEESELSRSDRSQLVITTVSIILTNLLKSKKIEADICAGFSLGEYSALYASGIISFEDTIKLVKERGIIMQRVCDKLSASSSGRQPGMAAVIGLSSEQVSNTIKKLSKEGICFPANLNSIKQTVISGTADGLEKAERLCKEAGCKRFIKLKVAGPFHSPLMEEAGKDFTKILIETEFSNPVKKLFSNVTGKEIKTGKEAKELAILHFTNPVSWINEEKEIANIINYKNVECQKNWGIYEIGPGNVLAGLWRDSGFSENINCLNTECFDLKI